MGSMQQIHHTPWKFLWNNIRRCSNVVTGSSEILNWYILFYFQTKSTDAKNRENLWWWYGASKRFQTILMNFSYVCGICVPRAVRAWVTMANHATQATCFVINAQDHKKSPAKKRIHDPWPRGFYPISQSKRVPFSSPNKVQSRLVAEGN